MQQQPEKVDPEAIRAAIGSIAGPKQPKYYPLISKCHAKYGGTIALSWLRGATIRGETVDLYVAGENGDQVVVSKVTGDYTPQEMGVYVNIDLGLPLPSYAKRAAANDNVPQARRIDVVNPADWHGEPIPPRQWYAEGLIPMRQVTILNGDGGVGKSLLALQIAAAGAMSLDTLDMEPWAGRVLYVGAEDDEDEFHRRLADIAEAHGKDLTDLWMFRLISLADSDALLSIPDRAGIMQPTSLQLGLEKYAREFKPRLIVLDTAADLFGGDEIKRAQVRQFIAMLRKLAMEIDCAIILLAHPSVAGMQTGTGSSGSTAWNNSVRSRLYLTRPTDKDADPDLRILKTMKSNYGKTGDEIRLRWKDGSFVLDDGKPSPGNALIAAKAERVFKDLLAAINASGDRVAKTKGINYAPRVMAERPDAEGMTVKQLEAAMLSLLAAGVLRIDMEGPPSKMRQRLVLVGGQPDE
ncbi:ATPase [Ensifer sp. MMN_5]|nr:ATPase [Ensifer sp. MMN_5]